MSRADSSGAAAAPRYKAACLQGRPEVAALAGRIEAALRKRRAQRGGDAPAPSATGTGSAAAVAAAQEKARAPVWDAISVRTDAAAQLRHEQARCLAAKYVMREAHALALLSEDDAGIGGQCLRAVLECEDMLRRVVGTPVLRKKAAAAGGNTNDPAADGMHETLAAAARDAVAAACGCDYATCKELAGDYVRPVLARRTEEVAEACAAMIDAAAQGGLQANLAATSLRLAAEQQTLRAAVRDAAAGMHDARRVLNATLRSIILLTQHLLTTYRIPSEHYDVVYAEHLLALVNALRAKLSVLVADVEARTYNDATVPALRAVHGDLSARAGAAEAELRELQAVCEQYDEAEAASAEFASLNEQVRQLEKERAALEKEVMQTRRT